MALKKCLSISTQRNRFTIEKVVSPILSAMKSEAYVSPNKCSLLAAVRNINNIFCISKGYNKLDFYNKKYFATRYVLVLSSAERLFGLVFSNFQKFLKFLIKHACTVLCFCIWFWLSLNLIDCILFFSFP